jgi:hypothetical protein
MRTLIAKTKVAEVTDFGNNNKRTRLAAVAGDSPENKSFSNYTPSLSVEILVNNPDAVDFFKAGEEVFLTFHKERLEVTEAMNLLKNAYAVLKNVKYFAERCPDGGNISAAIANVLIDAGIKMFKDNNGGVHDIDFILSQAVASDALLINTAGIHENIRVELKNGNRMELQRLT